MILFNLVKSIIHDYFSQGYEGNNAALKEFIEEIKRKLYHFQ